MLLWSIFYFIPMIVCAVFFYLRSLDLSEISLADLVVAVVISLLPAINFLFALMTLIDVLTALISAGIDAMDTIVIKRKR